MATMIGGNGGGSGGGKVESYIVYPPYKDVSASTSNYYVMEISNKDINSSNEYLCICGNKTNSSSGSIAYFIIRDGELSLLKSSTESKYGNFTAPNLSVNGITGTRSILDNSNLLFFRGFDSTNTNIPLRFSRGPEDDILSYYSTISVSWGTNKPNPANFKVIWFDYNEKKYMVGFTMESGSSTAKIYLFEFIEKSNFTNSIVQILDKKEATDLYIVDVVVDGNQVYILCVSGSGLIKRMSINMLTKTIDTTIIPYTYRAGELSTIGQSDLTTSFIGFIDNKGLVRYKGKTYLYVNTSKRPLYVYCPMNSTEVSFKKTLSAPIESAYVLVEGNNVWDYQYTHNTRVNMPIFKYKDCLATT